MMKKVLIVLCLIVLSGVLLSAQSIGLEEVRTLALANSRSLAGYNLDIQSSILSERSHLYTMLPSVSAGYSITADYLSKDWGIENPVDTFRAGFAKNLFIDPLSMEVLSPVRFGKPRKRFFVEGFGKVFKGGDTYR